MQTALITSLWVGLWSLTAACEADLKVATTGELSPPVEPGAPTTTKLAPEGNCIDPDLTKVSNDVSLTLCNGERGQGELDLSSVRPSECVADGIVGCVTTEAFRSANMSVAVAANIKSGASIAGVAGSVVQPAACSADGEINCVANVDYKAARMANFSAANIASGMTIAGVLGTGTGEAHLDCASDGAVGCVTTATYKSANTSAYLGSDIKSGITIAGVAGSLGNCADGASGCVVQGPTFKAAASADLAAGNIKSGVTIGGVAGSVTPSPANCVSDGASACVVEGTNFIAADKTKVVNTNIKSGVSLGGVTGSYGPTCASDGAGSCLVDGSTYKAALLSNFSGADIETGVTIAGVAGSATLESHANCASDGASGCIVEGTNYIAADKSKVVNTNIKSGVSLGGVTGNYGPTCASDGAGSCLVDGTTYKAAAMANVVDTNIKTGVTIAGVAGNVTPSPGNCASDGASSCVVDGTTYKAAATATAVAGNIKNGVSIAGVTGDYPSSTYPLAGANGSIADLDTTTFNAKIKSSADFEWFDSVGNPYTHAGEPNISAGLILNGVFIFGTVGTYVPDSMSVASLSAVKGTNKVALSWTRSGGSGVIIVRRAGASVLFAPSHGVTYAQGYTSGSDEVIYRGSAATVDDTSVVDGTTYYYKAFAYNSDNAYSAGSNEASVFYTDWNGVCGGAGDSCYDNTAAKTAGTAITPLGKNLEYVTASGSFKVWKEVGTNKILRATGLDAWAMKLNLNGKGFLGAGNEFIDYTSLEGRKCPPSVYIDDTNKVSSGNCLYYSVGYAAQGLNAAGISQTTPFQIGLNNWSNYNGGSARWYVGNINTCSNKGMRLPTIFETSTTTTSDPYFPTDATPTFAGASNGIPSHTSGSTWTASAYTNASVSYWYWQGNIVFPNNHTNGHNVRCVLP